MKAKYLIVQDSEGYIEVTDMDNEILTRDNWEDISIKLNELYENTSDDLIDEINLHRRKEITDFYKSLGIGEVGVKKEPKKRSGYVYIVKTDDNFYKVGITNNVKNRIRGLQTSNPKKLELVGSFYSKDYQGLESHLHGKFDKHRRSGEWFELDIDAVDEMLCIAKEWVKLEKSS